MRFADYAKMYLKAGNGGPGSVHFRREKFVPRGGPDGGDGGRGGDIILRGNVQMNTLLDLRYNKYVKAPHGNPGEGGRGLISSSALEMSNVDLAYEFTELITTSRAFQANTRVVTTSDEVLVEVVNMKR